MFLLLALVLLRAVLCDVPRLVTVVTLAFRDGHELSASTFSFPLFWTLAFFSASFGPTGVHQVSFLSAVGASLPCLRVEHLFLGSACFVQARIISVLLAPLLVQFVSHILQAVLLSVKRERVH